MANRTRKAKKRNDFETSRRQPLLLFPERRARRDRLGLSAGEFAVLERLSSPQKIQAFLNDPATKDYFTKQYINASYKNPDEFSAYIKSELTKWEGVIAKAGLKQ